MRESDVPEKRVLISATFAAPDCGDNLGWRKNNGICYYYNDTDIVDFHTALSRCYKEKAQLVSILDQQEQTFVVSMVGSQPSLKV